MIWVLPICYSHKVLSNVRRTRTAAVIIVTTVGILLVAVAAYQIYMASFPDASNGLSFDSSTGVARFPSGSIVKTGLTDVRGCYCVLDGTDWAYSSNATRVLFDSSGVIAAIHPYSGTEIFSNGTSLIVPPCQYQYPTSEIKGGGLSADGTFSFVYSNGMTVTFLANGTCSEA